MVYSSSSSGSNSTNVGEGNVVATAVEAGDNNLTTVRQEDDWQNKNGVGEPMASVTPSETSLLTSLSPPPSEYEIWACTWTVWMRIATVATSTTEIDHHQANQSPPTSGNTSTAASEDRRGFEYQPQQQSLQHKQQFLTALLQIFPLIFTHIKTR